MHNPRLWKYFECSWKAKGLISTQGIIDFDGFERNILGSLQRKFKYARFLIPQMQQGMLECKHDVIQDSNDSPNKEANGKIIIKYLNCSVRLARDLVM